MTLTISNPRTQEVRRILEDRRAALLTDLRHDIHDACAGVEAVESDDAADDLDAGAIMVRSSVRFDLMHLKGETLLNINEALTRIDEGRYGICEWCGSEIPERRLRALPFALRCISCEEENEAAQRKRMHPSDSMRRPTEETGAERDRRR
jgi:RNA polymerase-binding transcription factor